MSKFILLECNRDRAININQQTELKDEFKNTWTNQVSNSGIIVNSGDVLTIDQSIVNVKGASTEVMEFTGNNNLNNVVDNRIGIDVAYYINHTGKNTGNMPMIGHKIFRGVGDLRNVVSNTTGGGNVPDGGNTFVAGDQRLAYTITRFQNSIGDRSLGETFFMNFPFGNNMAPAAILDPYDNTTPFVNQLTIPNTGKVFKISLLTRGGGLAGNADTGYVAGTEYGIATNDTAAQGTTMKFKVLTVQTMGSIPNVIETFEITDFGDKDFNGVPNDAQPHITITLTLPAAKGTSQVFKIDDLLNSNYKSSDIRRFDGERYFPLNIGFTGLAFFEDAFIARTDGLAPPTIDANFDLDKMQQQPFLREKEVTLQVPKGFLTPSNVANILTEQLARPERIDELNNNGDFIDVNKIDFFHTDPVLSYSTQDNPNIIGSQVFQPTSANFVNFGKDIPSNNSFCGRRTTFYQSIAWKEPERWIGLVPAFKRFSVNSNVRTVSGNDITVNYGARATDNDIFGDFTRQGVGEFGTHSVIINDFLGINNEVAIDRGGIIVSNIRFTRKNLIKLRNIQECEKYMGDLSLQLDTTSKNFKDYLSVNLDLGIYDDELSSQGVLTTNGLVGASQNTNQRFKFATIDEAVADGFILVNVDRGHSRALNGFQRDLLNLQNDGQQLSNIWIKSRYNDKFEFVANGANNANDNDIRFQDSFDSWNNSAHFNTANTDINQVFGAGYFDVNDNEYKSVSDLMALAKEFDLAVIPVNPPQNPADINQNAEWFENDFPALDSQPPFVGFISAQRAGDNTLAVFDKTKQFSKTDVPNWVIDASNCKFGMMLGFDPSFTRNKAVSLINNQFGSEGQGSVDKYLNIVNIGAVEPRIDFDPAFSRFAISGLNTPDFQGNGLTTDDTLEFTPSDAPEQQVITFNRKHQVLPSRQKNIGTPVAGASKPISIGQYATATQKMGSFIDSQSGVSITKLKLYNNEGVLQQTLDPNDFFFDNDYLFAGCMLHKMGFEIETLLPKFGGSDAFFRDPTLFKDATQTYQQARANIIKPLTTGADISSTTTQTLSLNTSSAPLFDLGGDTISNAIRPDTEQGSITATNLPNKFDFSYLTINSSLVQEGTDTIYIGGSDNQSKLPCMTYLTRENNESDFFFQNERTFTFTATKDFTITDITTDIKMPDGSRPRLDPHSTIIYKIEKPLNALNPQSEQIAQPVVQHERKQNQQRNLEK